MEEAKQTKPGAASDDASAQTVARQDEATNSDTLSDIQQTQIDSAAAQNETTAASDSNSAPAPDGTPDNTRGASGDGRDSGGPM
jgi:hypothetical protein